MYRKDRSSIGNVVSGISTIARIIGHSPAHTLNLLEAGRLPATLIDNVWIGNAELLATIAPSLRTNRGRPRKKAPEAEPAEFVNAS
jgi:hypothetical protein